MTQIPDSAVQAFIERYEIGCNHQYDENSIRAALIAALPYLQPVDVVALKATHEREMAEVITERDQAEAWADKLAHAIGGEAVGEHSNMNNPWAAALDIAENRKPVDVDAVRRQSFEEAAKALDDLVDYWKSLPAFNRAYAMRSTIKTADDYRAISAEPAQGEQWRDMNDAPKDGTKIDVWMMPQGYRLTDVFWSDIQEAWCQESEYPDEPTPLSIVPYPAFWMPCPPAPEAGR